MSAAAHAEEVKRLAEELDSACRVNAITQAYIDALNERYGEETVREAILLMKSWKRRDRERILDGIGAAVVAVLVALISLYLIDLLGNL